MKRHVFTFLAVFVLTSASTLAQAPLRIASSDNFSLLCINADACGDGKDLARPGEQVLAEMEAVTVWLTELGFPENGTLETSSDTGKEILRIDPRPAGENECPIGTTACFKIDMLGNPRIFLPLENLDDILDRPSFLAHEYLHSLQIPRQAGAVNWLREAVATAVGFAWDARRGLGVGIYPPFYNMTLDRRFFDAGDPGYGNWAYLLALGDAMGSRDSVAYLADAAFMREVELYTSAESAMTPFYDGSKVGGQTFDRFFPRFVARFNNMERRDGEYFYYTDITEQTVSFAGTDGFETREIEGSALPYAVKPLRLKLEIGPAGAQRDPKDRLLMADIEIVSGDAMEALTIVSEHAMGETQHRKSYMIDGSDPTDELGLMRVVHAPTQVGNGAEASAFRLRVRTTPVELAPPVCFQAGSPADFEPVGFDAGHTDNWRLVTDNGTAEGLTITPARAGRMEVHVEIDSPVTRQEGTLDPRRPESTRVSLGSFQVAGDDCMIRLTMGKAVLTYSTVGSYTEFLTPTGEAMYFAPADMAIYDGGWKPLPPMAKQMVLGRMMAQMPLASSTAPGEDEARGLFLSRMPHAFSRRFGWANLRRARGLDGGRTERTPAACPDGASGCTTTTFSMDGNAVPVVFDAQNRPVAATFASETIRFDYGNWNIRRPPGW
ncbi:hypothetical protein HMH01_13130 [Halovulum dunhuangense]|uniref:Uncharacterized protein n=1 Tax=Halovulum dunhuangense TaxID=1505036 RepID=A0A849L4V2_9RHOB|nr:hypothetical protein [Halovulum dunhuangense]NNU81379.1 hypothetical protein [Halovulum dunhuangense]